MSSPHVGDYGTVFNLTIYRHDNIVLDLSGALVRQIIFYKPDTSTVITTGSLTNDGTDGKMYYTSPSGLLDTAGEWGIQGRVEYPTAAWSTEVQGFVVEENQK